MATLADSLVTTITTEWGNGGGGGAAPTIAALVDYRKDIAPTTEQIVIRLPIYADRKPINDLYANVTHKVLIRVKTTTSDTRLYEIVDELRWVINNVAVTGINRQFCSGGEDKTDSSQQIFIYDMRVTCEEHVASSSTAYAASASTAVYVKKDGTEALTADWDAGAFEIRAQTLEADVTTGTAPLTIASTTKVSNLNVEQVDGCDVIDEDNMVSDSDVHVPTQQSTKAYVDAAGGGDAFKTITGITNDVVADSATDTLTLASANANLGIVGTAATDTVTFTSSTTPALDSAAITGELDMTGAGAIIDMNPSDAAGKAIIDITPSAAISSGAWRGIKMSGVSLDPSAGGCTIKGIDMDFIGVDLSNNPGLEGVYCRLPATYGGGAEYAGYFTGDGKTVKICSDTYALEVTGNVFQTQGLWYSTNNVSQAYYAMYNNLNNGNPFFTIGAASANRINIQTYFNAGTQVLDYAQINTLSSSGVNTDGNIRFKPDGTEVIRFNTAADTNQVKITGNLEISGNITDTTDTMTVANLADLLMFGSANAAWVPCVLEDVLPTAFYIDGNGHVANIDGTDGTIYYTCPLPTLKGGLKLYITGTRVSLADADANNKVDTTYVFGYTSTVRQTLDTDATDKTTVALHTDTFAAVDASGHQVIKLCISCVNTDTDALGVQYVMLQCYYAV